MKTTALTRDGSTIALALGATDRSSDRTAGQARRRRASPGAGRSRGLPLAALLLLAACSSGQPGVAADGAGPGARVEDGSPPITFPDGGDATCGSSAFAVAPAHPNVMILFDRSCSMRRCFDKADQFAGGPTDPRARWFAGRSAVDQLTQAFQSRVRFGLMVFPRPNKGCGDQPVVNIVPQLMAHKTLLAWLDKPDVQPYTLCNQPGGTQPHVTPTMEALTAAGKIPALADSTRPNHILLITDGGATCNATAQGLGLQAAGLFGKGISTSVVGFGDAGTNTATSMLDAMAKAGGLPRPGKTSYWLASSPKDLVAAVKTIVGKELTCTFKLKGDPPDKDRLYAYLDGTQVPAGGVDGWTYEPAANTITFKGKTCAKIQAGEVKNISLVYGCPKPACAPAPEVCDGFDNDCDGTVDEGCLK